MEALNSLGILLGSSWASGINLYMTVGALGIMSRLGVINLPGDMDVLAHPAIIITAIVLYAVEFFADKIPVVDSTWDSIHTFARVAINTSPEPITNSIASVTEDSLVVGILYLIVTHPIIASILVVLFILFSIWFLKVMFRFLRKVFRFLTGANASASASS